jgi:alkylhydroperoxidase/carboxymuconolactone decarboxylase family protein YurZ
MVADIVKLFDDDNTGEMLIDDMEFHKAMKTRFGFRGMPWVLDEVFKSIDLDGSGEIGFDELFEFVRGRRHSLDRRTREVRCLALQTAKGYDLTDLDWDADQLRLQIKTALERRKLSTTDLIRARDLASTLAPHVGGIKLGLEFFLAHGAEGVAAVRPPDMPLFLDLKLHDIPNTVAGALRAIAPVAPTFVTIHASGGPDMMRRAAETAAEAARAS